MKVIEVEKEITAHDKARYLHVLREDIGEEAFRIALAKVYTKHLIELKRWKGKKVVREDILFFVNMILKENGCEEVSYSFVKKVEESIAH
ncbi:hypothetical protein [Robertmurraya massiliosenegalensis]|uniref:hypothetical protein n=1 Tax=Robertmurraya massiliosenegalensis TaxID=1287657 RepID=UPI0002E50B54|nr:hypothetical protein [Robertmurraya massiliosenegalensis]